MLYALFIPFPVDQGNYNVMNIYIYQPNRPIVQQRQQMPQQQHHQARAVHNLMIVTLQQQQQQRQQQQQQQQRQTFPELVGRPPRVAASYVSARG